MHFRFHRLAQHLKEDRAEGIAMAQVQLADFLDQYGLDIRAGLFPNSEIVLRKSLRDPKQMLAFFIALRTGIQLANRAPSAVMPG